MYVYNEIDGGVREVEVNDVKEFVEDLFESGESFVSVMNDEYVVIEDECDKYMIFVGRNSMDVNEVNELIEKFYEKDEYDLVWDVDKVIEWIYK